VEWVEVPSGSKEMAAVLSLRLAASPAVVIQAHGAFTRGRTLEEAFFHACLANNAGYVVRLLEKLKRNVDRLRAKARARPESFFDLRLSAYDSSPGRIFGQVRGKVRAEFAAAGARFFESRLSPFHTGSASLRAGSSMIFAPQVSRPRDLDGPLLKLPLGAGEEDAFEAGRHKALYAARDFQALLHCYLPEAEALARGADPTAGGPAESLRPIDAEGRYLYPMAPVVPPGIETEELGRLLQEYKMVVIRGGGVWAAGYRDLAEALHHPSSLRDICLYRIGAFERGLNLKKLESS
jgi:ribulose-5-phosphate 4-epimerase/fuculose-1-phosphate aldolase